MMGGRSEVESAPGEGSTFRFTLDLPVPDAQPGEDVREGDDAVASREELSGLRVLVAEDNATNRRIIAALLEKLGVAADMAENGQETWTRLRVNGMIWF